MFSYLVRFLALVADYSSENKMTASNLGICIGCSLLYPQDQSSNAYTSGSTILELMIIHHKQLFPNSSQQEQSTKSFKSQPDLIPTEFYSVLFHFCFCRKQFPFIFRKVEVVQMKIY